MPPKHPALYMENGKKKLNIIVNDSFIFLSNKNFTSIFSPKATQVIKLLQGKKITAVLLNLFRGVDKIVRLNRFYVAWMD